MRLLTIAILFTTLSVACIAKDIGDVQAYFQKFIGTWYNQTGDRPTHQKLIKEVDRIYEARFRKAVRKHYKDVSNDKLCETLFKLKHELGGLNCRNRQ